MITAEPTGGVVWHASRGAITLRVEVQGRPAHVGQAHLGVNAFEQMVQIAEPLATLAHELLARRTAYPLESDEARGSMLVVGGASGSGANFNVVPGAAWFSRRPPLQPRGRPRRGARAPDDDDRRRRRARRRRGQRRGPAAAAVRGHRRAPSRRASRWRAASAAVEGAAPRFELCPGVLETRWYAQLGIPAFAYGAGRLDVSHGPDEYIDEAAMRRCAAVYALFAGTVLREAPSVVRPAG